MPSLAESSSRPVSSTTPSEISRSARDTTAELPSQADVPGAASGRHLRQGRNPAASAAAAQANQRIFSGVGGWAADGAAVNAGGYDAAEEPPVETRVAA